MRRNNSKAALTLALIGMLAGGLAPSALAQAGGPAFTVTNLADSGPGSLRQAILDANARPGPDVIDFSPGLRGTILLISGALTITDSLAINGPGAGWLAVNGNHASRIFEIEGAANTVTIAGLTITQGLAGMGGGILLVDGSLTLSRVFLFDNRAIGGSNPSAGISGGGGIGSVMGTVQITDSALIANQAVGGNGGNGLGGAILSSGPLTLTNSIIAGNRALGGSGGTGSGGGIFLGPVTILTSSSVQNSLISGNLALGGAGGAGEGGGLTVSGNNTLTVTNSTINENVAQGGNGSDAVNGGNGLGGGLFVNTFATVILESGGVTGNDAVGGSNGGQGIGGGIYSLGNLTVGPGATIAGNRASTTDANVYPPPGPR
jgi:hypothetical protein